MPKSENLGSPEIDITELHAAPDAEDVVLSTDKAVEKMKAASKLNLPSVTDKPEQHQDKSTRRRGGSRNSRTEAPAGIPDNKNKAQTISGKTLVAETAKAKLDKADIPVDPKGGPVDTSAKLGDASATAVLSKPPEAAGTTAKKKELVSKPTSQFEELVGVPAEDMTKLLAAFDTDTLALALSASTQELREAMFAALTPKVSKEVEDKISALAAAATPGDDSLLPKIEAVQKAVVQEFLNPKPKAEARTPEAGKLGVEKPQAEEKPQFGAGQVVMRVDAQGKPFWPAGGKTIESVKESRAFFAGSSIGVSFAHLRPFTPSTAAPIETPVETGSTVRREEPAAVEVASTPGRVPTGEIPRGAAGREGMLKAFDRLIFANAGAELAAAIRVLQLCKASIEKELDTAPDPQIPVLKRTYGELDVFENAAKAIAGTTDEAKRMFLNGGDGSSALRRTSEGNSSGTFLERVRDILNEKGAAAAAPAAQPSGARTAEAVPTASVSSSDLELQERYGVRPGHRMMRMQGGKSAWIEPKIVESLREVGGKPVVYFKGSSMSVPLSELAPTIVKVMPKRVATTKAVPPRPASGEEPRLVAEITAAERNNHEVGDSVVYIRDGIQLWTTPRQIQKFDREADGEVYAFFSDDVRVNVKRLYKPKGAAAPVTEASRITIPPSLRPRPVASGEAPRPKAPNQPLLPRFINWIKSRRAKTEAGPSGAAPKEKPPEAP